MPDAHPGTRRAAAGVAVFGLACCAGAPLMLAALSGTALGTLVGAATGVVALVVAAAAVVRVRRNRAGASAIRRPTDWSQR